MEKIKINLKDRSYPIEIGKDILFKTDFSKGNKYAIITDSNVRKLYGEKLRRCMKSQHVDALFIDFPAGEKSKTPEMAITIGRELARRDFDRKDIILALGGGVVGDLVGYVASFYKRGINYIHVPTTLLAQVDSSIGGKTGVNIEEGKNLFGYFHQPLAVITDISTLKTLPEKEIKNGLTEIIKYAITQDKNLFEYLEKNYSGRDDEFFLNIIERCCKLKAGVVEKDEKEREERKIMNYGHTIGHAIEAAEKYNIPHGEAIALGMVYEGKISNALGILDNSSLKRQNSLIKATGLPTTYNKDINKLIKIMRTDKKVKDKEIYFILPKKIGEVRKEKGKVAFPVDESIIRKCLKE